MNVDSALAFLLKKSYLLLLCLPLMAGAQSGELVVNFRHYTISDGLSHNHIYQIFQDSRGILWAIAKNGLNRFDGQDFKLVRSFDAIDMNATRIYLEDKDGDLWIKYDAGKVFLINIYSEQIRKPNEKMGEGFPPKIGSIVPGLEGSLLVQTSRDSVWRFAPGQKPVLVYAATGHAVAPIVERENGIIWLEYNRSGQGGAFIALNPARKQIVRVPYFSEHTYTKGFWARDSIYFVTKDSFFVANENGLQRGTMLRRFMPGYSFQDPYITGNFPASRLDTQNGDLWLAFPNQLAFFDAGGQVKIDFTKEYFQLISSNIYHIFIDHQRNIWLSTFNGLYQIQVKANQFDRFLYQDPARVAPANMISCRSIRRAADGQLYSLAGNCIYRVNRKGDKVWCSRVEKSAELLGFTAGDDGSFWLSDHDLVNYNWSSGQTERYPIPYANRHLNSWLLCRIGDTILMDHPLMLFNLKTHVFSLVDDDERNPELKKMDVYEARKRNNGKWWLLSSSGLYVYERGRGVTERFWSGGQGTHYLPADDFRAIHEDTDGACWLATSTGLLYWLPQEGKYRLFTVKDGLSSDICHSVLPDEDGFLWISSDFGLMQFEKNTGKVKSYFEGDGLGMNEFNRISWFKDANGSLFFGGINGIVGFHPKNFIKGFSTAQDVQLVLTECALFSGSSKKEEDIRADYYNNGAIVMRPGDRFLRLQFALTDYETPTAILYDYMIEGYESVWHSGKGNVLRLAGLPYGNYTLYIKSRTIAGAGSMREMRIPLCVLRPFYLKWWFLMAVAMAVIYSILWYIRFRTNALKAQALKLEAAVQQRTQTIQAQKEKLDQLSAFRTRLYTNVTHEFRTPLTMILGPVKQIVKSLGEAQTQAIKQQLTQIEHNAMDMLGLVNQLLDINKLDEGAMAPSFVQSDVLAYIHQIMSAYRLTAASKGIEWVFESGMEHCVLDFDADKLQKILGNLWSNAIKFTPAGGRIVVQFDAKEGCWEIRVKDNGVGIDELHLPFIFDRFFQADNTLTRTNEGTGIGLALAKELVVLMGGEIQVESSLGKGASFLVRLPVHLNGPLLEHIDHATLALPRPISSSVATEAEPIAEPETEGLLYILIIEDHPDLAQYIRTVLDTEKYRIDIRTNGVEGLAYSFEAVPDIVILDVMMPGLDGFGVCEQLKLDLRTNHIPVVMLTALTEQSDRVHGLRCGADAFISKPFNEEELTVVVEQLLLVRARLQEKYRSSMVGGGMVIGSSVDESEDDFVQKCKSIVLKHLDDTAFEAKEFCIALGLSSSQLHRKLSALTGFSPGRFIHHVRLVEAQRLLAQEGQLTVSEIAYRTGFNDPGYFTRLFTREFGNPPSFFRK